MGSLDVDGNAKVLKLVIWDGAIPYFAKTLQAVVLQARKLGKAVYVFSIDSQGDKVAHVNYVPPTLKEKGGDARVWATKVSEILGGKVCPNIFTILSHLQTNTIFQAGGKEDSAQGSGTEIDRLEEAIEAARDYFSTRWTLTLLNCTSTNVAPMHSFL